MTRVRFTGDHLLPVGPGVVQRFAAGREVDLPPERASAAIAAGVAVAVEPVAPAPADDEDGA